MGRIIGIDLGTTNSAAAFWDHGRPRMIPNERGHYTTPSVVAFTSDGKVLIGEAARNQSLVNAERTIIGVKREMGSRKHYQIGPELYTPVEISALILKKLKDDAEAFLDDEVTEAVITVPAYFNETQRRATREAGLMAGFHVRRILNEPTAAALVYNHEEQFPDDEDAYLLVYDLGGGTFDISLLKSRGHKFEVLATRGDNHLGGMDFDQMMLDKVVTRFEKEAYPGIREDHLMMQQLRDQVEKVKIELSTQEEASLVLPFFRKKGPAEHFVYNFTRNELSSLIQADIRKTGELVAGTLDDAGIIREKISCMILSGGSSRIPLVGQLLNDRFGWKALNQVNPDETVALGAAIQSAFLDKGDAILTDVTPFTLGVEVVGGECAPVIERNTALPVRGKRLFTTVEDNQESVEVHVLQGESSRAEQNLSLGRFLLSGIRSGHQGEPRIEVSFMIDEDGILHVEAIDRDTSARQKVTMTSEGVNGEPENRDQLLSRVQSIQRRLEMLMDQKRTLLGEEFVMRVNDELIEAIDGIPELEIHKIRERRLWLESLLQEANARIHSLEMKL